MPFLSRARSGRFARAAFAGIAALALGIGAAPARAQEQAPQQAAPPFRPAERATFLSLDGHTTLVASLLRPRDDGVHPALVLLHGCTGLQRGGRIFPVYRSWARLFAAQGYVVLSVDSAGPRGVEATCTASPARRVMLRERPRDVYAALQFLQARPSVRADRVGVVGWSQGGNMILRAIRGDSAVRPAALAHDFRAAVAFYPGGCSEKDQSRPYAPADPQTWTTKIPLLVLQGDADNWTEPGPCQAFIAGAIARGAPVTFKSYPDAVHVFDAPNLPVRERPAYRKQDGTVPLSGTDPAARADALQRVPDFLARYLQD